MPTEAFGTYHSSCYATRLAELGGIEPTEDVVCPEL